ncbi:MAG TPA: putative lipid II flippase FtsW [Terriglobales bacterium]|nr:putative lipid II flippase FtsW [Terriglobales bacterium]
MAKRVSVDKWLFTVTLLLVFIGLVMVFSASAVMAKERFGSPYGFLLRQMAWAAAGLLAMVGIMNIDYHHFRRPPVVFTFLGITSLLLLAVFLFRDSHNTHRWIKFSGLSFQPSEVAKPALILYLAYFLESRWQQIADWKHVLLPAAAPTLLFALLIVKEPDLGTAIACIAISAAVLFVAGMNMKYLWYALAGSLLPLYFLIVRVPWRWARVQAFLDPFKDPQGKGFHTIQSMIAVSTGGLTGLGLMEGKQKLFYLPEPHTDFIFAVTAEELGLWGSLLVVSLFGIFLYHGVRAALRTSDMFGKFLATGITAMVVVQALFNISVVLALMPAKGIPLPFISYGGTSLFITLATVGVMLNITQQAE